MTRVLKLFAIAFLGLFVAQSCAAGDPETDVDRADRLEQAQIKNPCLILEDGAGCSIDGVKGACVGRICCTVPCKGLTEYTCCDDGNACTTDACIVSKAGICRNTALDPGKECGDRSGVCLESGRDGVQCCSGSSCNFKDTCRANGSSEGGAKLCGLNGNACELCDDGNPCTDDVCTERGTCEHPLKADGVSCESDGDVCNGTSSCLKGECVAGKPLDCRSANPCVTASCDKSKGCVTENNTGACNDGNPCTVNDQCSGGTCQAGSAVNCDDNNPCTADRCDTAAGGCAHDPLPNTQACDDRNGCTQNDKCNGEGKCVGTGGSVICEDTNPCSIDGCANDICDFTQHEVPGTPCASANKCMVNTTCNADGQCAGGVPKDCNDSNPCTEDSCNPETGQCVSTALSVGGCSDDSACTTNDHCEDGTCVGDGIECTAIDDCHVAGTCDAATGLCNDPRRENGAECESGAGVCSNGACVAKPTESEGGAGGAGPEVIAAGGAPSDGGAAGTEEGGTGADEALADAGDASAEGGRNGNGSNATGNRAGDEDPDSAARGKPFVRKGGGCGTAAPGVPPADFSLFALLGAAAFVAIRARTSFKGALARDSK